MMKLVRFVLLTALVATQAARLLAQAPAPVVAPAQMPAGSAMPIGSSEQIDAGGGYGPAYSGYNNVDFNAYGGDCYCNNGACNNGTCGPQFGGGKLLSFCGRGYVQVDAILMNRSDAAPVSVVTQTGTGTTLMAGNAPWFGFETLPRITTGYVLPNDTAVEATFWYKDDFDASFGVGSATNTLLIPNDTTLGDVYRRANMTLATGIHNGEINLVETGRIFNCLAGFRWMQIQDRMWLAAQNVAGTTANNTSIDTYNTLLGGQAGGRMAVSRGLFTLEGTGKAGLFYNQGSSQSFAQTGLIAAPAVWNKPISHGSCESFVGELNTMLTIRPSAAVAIRFGYQVMWICNTALAVDQFATTNVYSAAAQSLNDHGDIILHGPSAGLDVRW